MFFENRSLTSWKSGQQICSSWQVTLKTLRNKPCRWYESKHVEKAGNHRVAASLLAAPWFLQITLSVHRRLVRLRQRYFQLQRNQKRRKRTAILHQWFVKIEMAAGGAMFNVLPTDWWVPVAHESKNTLAMQIPFVLNQSRLPLELFIVAAILPMRSLLFALSPAHPIHAQTVPIENPFSVQALCDTWTTPQEHSISTNLSSPTKCQVEWAHSPLPF